MTSIFSYFTFELMVVVLIKRHDLIPDIILSPLLVLPLGLGRQLHDELLQHQFLVFVEAAITDVVMLVGHSGGMLSIRPL